MTEQPIPVDAGAVIPILQGRLSEAELRAAMWQARAQQLEARMAELEAQAATPHPEQ